MSNTIASAVSLCKHLVAWKDVCLMCTLSVTTLIAAHRFGTRASVSHRFSPSLDMLLRPGCGLSSLTFWRGHNVGQLHTDGRNADRSRQEGEPVTREHV